MLNILRNYHFSCKWLMPYNLRSWAGKIIYLISVLILANWSLLKSSQLKIHFPTLNIIVKTDVTWYNVRFWEHIFIIIALFQSMAASVTIIQNKTIIRFNQELRFYKATVTVVRLYTTCLLYTCHFFVYLNLSLSFMQVDSICLSLNIERNARLLTN